MQIRIDHDNRDRSKPFKIVFLDLKHHLSKARLPAPNSWQTRSSDGHPAMRVNMQNAPPHGSVYEIPDQFVQLVRQDYEGNHVALNCRLVFRGLLSVLEDFDITASEGRENGRGSELATRVEMKETFVEDFRLSEEISFPERFYEGATHRITINAYEHNRMARAKCIQHYGTHCSVCQFDFGHVYGYWGEGFIHVHHLKRLSEISEQYEVDPIADLRPVCPNCHAMIHRRTPPFSIEEVKRLIKEASQRNPTPA